MGNREVSRIEESPVVTRIHFAARIAPKEGDELRDGPGVEVAHVNKGVY